MTRLASITLAALILNLAVLAGCATYDGIPTGRWEGRGVYTEYQANNLTNDDKDKKEVARSNEYETSMTITEEEIEGHDALVIEILSKRDELETMDSDQTHMRLILQPYKTLPNGTQLLSLIAVQSSLKSEKSLPDAEWKEHLEGLGSATLEERDGALILHLDYNFLNNDSPPFQDVLVLYGNKAYKIGAVRGSEFRDGMLDTLNLITWSESLRKVE